jgi:5-methylcytosine-specific restriction endonuclease McrA
MNYKKVYMRFFKIDECDFVGCESCSKKAVDIHHLTFRSQGGKDVIDNLAALCRECHNKCHDHKEFNESVRIKHLKKI